MKNISIVPIAAPALVLPSSPCVWMQYPLRSRAMRAFGDEAGVHDTSFCEIVADTSDECDSEQPSSWSTHGDVMYGPKKRIRNCREWLESPVGRLSDGIQSRQRLPLGASRYF